MLGNTTQVEGGVGNLAAGRDIKISVSTPIIAGNFTEVFQAADAHFKNEVSASGKVFRLSKEIDYSSKELFCSLIQIGIPFDAAIRIPFQIVPWLSDAVDAATSPKLISTADIRIAVVNAIGGLAYSGSHTDEEVAMWCAAYIRRYGNPGNQFIKVLDNDKEKDLNYEYVKGTLLPHVLSRIIGLPKFSDPMELYSAVFSAQSVDLMSREVVRFLNTLNVYTIRYKTVIHLLQDIILEPPHPWLVNAATISKVATYNFERAIFHQHTIKKAGTKANSALFNQSARECFMHLCAAVLSRYGAFLGVGAKYGLLELRRILKMRQKNPALWSYCQIRSIEPDLESIGIKIAYFTNILERIRSLIDSSDTESKFGGLIEASDALIEITVKLFPDFEPTRAAVTSNPAYP